MKARPFAVGYRKGSGEGLVYGGILAALLAGFVAAYNHEPGLYIISALALMMSFYYFPLIEKGQPQLGANADGLFIGGIGFIGWAEIAQLEVFNTAVRSIRLSTLIVHLHRPLADVVAKPQKAPWWRKPMARPYRRKGDMRIEVALHPLQGAPEQIFERLKAFRPDLGG